MAGALKEKHVQHVYAILQAVSCPLVDGLYLQEADSMLQLLCTPSQHRTDILAWICRSISPSFGSYEAMMMRSKDPDVLHKGIAVVGQELMLCKADSLDLVKGTASPHRQLQFFEQLLSLLPGCRESAGHRIDAEVLLNELYAVENLPHLTQMLKPTFNPWPTHIKALRKGTRPSSKPGKAEGVDVAALLQQTQLTLEQLQSECEFLNSEEQSPGDYSPRSLCVVLRDIHQLMTTFSHVYETDLRAYCSRDPPNFSPETDIFQRVHQLLLGLTTELELIKEVSEVAVSMNEDVRQLQTQPRYWSRGEKRKLQDQLEELTRRVRAFPPLLMTSSGGEQTPAENVKPLGER